jgi:serine protease Do
MPLTGLEEAITSAVEKVTPSVVSVSTVKIFHDYVFRPLPVEGMGSGLIIGEKGYIVTNYHVAGRSKKIQVILSDGRRFDAAIVGGDPSYDVALLKIDADGLKPAKLGDSDKLKVGQIAIVIGNPLGFMLGGPTVTVGVISALKRKIKTEAGYIEDLIQTDAPINPGNSGGPLLNTDGEVVGISTAIVPYAQGIGFAIPINIVKDVLDQLIKYGRVVKPWLGIYGVTITPQLSEYYGLPVSSGVLVVDVAPESPAEEARILRGDIITSIDGEELSGIEELKSRIERMKPGKAVSLRVISYYGVRELSVRLREQE